MSSGAATRIAIVSLALGALTGCESLTVAQRAGIGWASVGSTTPNADLQQTYYLGSFDPRGQLPPAIYRVRVRGQSSILNQTRFASSWVPAEVVDSLTGSISVNMSDGTVSAARDGASKSTLEGAGRGLVLFGPEGFREAPRGHRLVVIMGSNPEQVEQAFSSALGTVAKVRFGQSGGALDRDLFARLTELASEREQLKALAAAR